MVALGISVGDTIVRVMIVGVEHTFLLHGSLQGQWQARRQLWQQNKAFKIRSFDTNYSNEGE